MHYTNELFYYYKIIQHEFFDNLIILLEVTMKLSLISKLSLVALGICSYSSYAHEYYRIEGSHEVIIPIKSAQIEINGSLILTDYLALKEFNL